MKLNEPQMNSVLQQIAKQKQWVSEITKLAQSFQVPDAYLKALSYYQSPAYAQMIEQTNALAKMVVPAAWTLPQSQLASAFKILEDQQKQLRDMAESPMVKMAKAINESASLFNADRQKFWKTSFDFLSQIDLEDRNHLADLAIQEVPVLENELANDIPELAEKELAQLETLFPFIKGLSIDQIKTFLIRLITMISLILSIKGCVDADIAHQDAIQAHQDAIQAHQDAIQAHQDFLESQKSVQNSQIYNPTSSAAKK